MDIFNRNLLLLLLVSRTMDSVYLLKLFINLKLASFPHKIKQFVSICICRVLVFPGEDRMLLFLIIAKKKMYVYYKVSAIILKIKINMDEFYQSYLQRAGRKNANVG